MKILIIEDNHKIIELVARTIKAMWVEVDLLSTVYGGEGIELVRKMHKEHPDAIILMVYSSNPGAYDLESLRDEGVISGAWDKKEFKPHHMINTINEELKKRNT